ncbi:hypothetical protein HID58_068184 [Brassica napus]|uniref:non-specific serine/threonine protein kinase n=1 Tax=Brassica napus TaxID=3708 RepID=A0ABQ7ZKL7_BRANA|nr:hypothetical protein HID58_068184 [Brassica napus]
MLLPELNVDKSSSFPSKILDRVLKAQNLNGSLPREFAGLPFLQEIELSRNYLNGPFLMNGEPCHFSVLGNRISGPIPKEIGNITTLISLILELNQISGKLPQELGNLPNIQRIFLSSNYLSGDIPSIFSKLTTLIDLRISELSGPGSPFPPLQNMTSIKTLDLSFNKLGGPIPVTYSALSRVNIFLTSNMLNGEVPSWMVDNGDKIDLIYNNFTNDPRTAECQKNAVNMFSSTSPLVANDYSNVSCLTFYGLHINCGGIELTVNGTKYDADSTDRPIFYDSRNGWVSSNTGKFMDDERSPKGVTFGANTFNIVDEAKGVGRAVVKSFLVMITNGKLEIRLFWAGKGTQATPVRGEYDFIPPKEAGTGSGCCCSCFDGVICGFNRLYITVERLLKTQESNGKSVSCLSSDFKNLDFKISSFSLRQIKVATNNFDPANKIGEGGFGPVHKVSIIMER